MTAVFKFPKLLTAALLLTHCCQHVESMYLFRGSNAEENPPPETEVAHLDGGQRSPGQGSDSGTSTTSDPWIATDIDLEQGVVSPTITFQEISKEARRAMDVQAGARATMSTNENLLTDPEWSDGENENDDDDRRENPSDDDDEIEAVSIVSTTDDETSTSTPRNMLNNDISIDFGPFTSGGIHSKENSPTQSGFGKIEDFGSPFQSPTHKKSDRDVSKMEEGAWSSGSDDRINEHSPLLSSHTKKLSLAKSPQGPRVRKVVQTPVDANLARRENQDVLHQLERVANNLPCPLEAVLLVLMIFAIAIVPAIIFYNLQH